MGFKAFMTTLAVAPVVALAACGSSSSSSSDDFTAKANDVCTTTERENNQISIKEGPPQSLDDAAALFAKFVPTRQKEQDQLEAIEPPSDQKSDWDAYVAARAESTKNLEQAVAAGKQGDDAATKAAIAKGSQLADKADAAAAKVGGIDACAHKLSADADKQTRDNVEEAAISKDYEHVCKDLISASLLKVQGGIEGCVKGSKQSGVSDSVEFGTVGGVDGVDSFAYQTKIHGGQLDGQVFDVDLTYEDGTYKISNIAPSA